MRTTAPFPKGPPATGLPCFAGEFAVTPDYCIWIEHLVFTNFTYEIGWHFLDCVSHFGSKGHRSWFAHRLPFLSFKSRDALEAEPVTDRATRAAMVPVWTTDILKQTDNIIDFTCLKELWAYRHLSTAVENILVGLSVCARACDWWLFKLSKQCLLTDECSVL